MYLPPPKIFTRSVALYAGCKEDVLPKQLFQLLLGALSKRVFDEDWYNQVYADVALGVKSGNILSGYEHFVDAGYWEGRLPCLFAVDEAWYRQYYPDVDLAIKSGGVVSAHTHYNTRGYSEGRFPQPPESSIDKQWYYAVSTLAGKP